MAYRNDTQYVRKREALKRQCQKNQTPCWICQRPFDYTLDWKHPNLSATTASERHCTNTRHPRKHWAKSRSPTGG
jgi:hypothetical protein